jgi:hypothetical protein
MRMASSPSPGGEGQRLQPVAGGAAVEMQGQRQPVQGEKEGGRGEEQQNRQRGSFRRGPAAGAEGAIEQPTAGERGAKTGQPQRPRGPLTGGRERLQQQSPGRRQEARADQRNGAPARARRRGFARFFVGRPAGHEQTKE